MDANATRNAIGKGRVLCCVVLCWGGMQHRCCWVETRVALGDRLTENSARQSVKEGWAQEHGRKYSRKKIGNHCNRPKRCLGLHRFFGLCTGSGAAGERRLAWTQDSGVKATESIVHRQVLWGYLT